MRSIREISEVSEKKVFLRVDLNVPVKNGVITDDFRIKKSFQSVDFLLKAGAIITLASRFEG